MTSVTQQLADLMLDLGTIEFCPSRPIRWVSGHLMPVYNDNRRLLADPGARLLVVRGFEEIVDHWNLSIDGVMGVATGGIAPATSLADRLGARLYFVRAAAKDHGLRRTVEGWDESAPSNTVLLVEDLVSTGGSSADAANAVHQVGMSINHGVAIFSYGFSRAAERFAALSFPFVMEALVTIEDLLGRAREHDRLEPQEIDCIRDWLTAPYSWGVGRETAP